MTETIRIDPVRPSPDVLAHAADLIRAGKLVAFPTETVYGLGANALDTRAVAAVFAAKGRPANNPLIVHVSSAAEARALTADWPEAARRLSERFWPGPLSLVLPRAAAVPDIVCAGGLTVAVRVPTHPVARALIRQAGVPIAAPSANRSGSLSPTSAAHVLQGLDGRIDLVLDGGPTPGGIESTVIDASEPVPRLLRPGPIPPGDIERIVGPLERSIPLADLSAPLASPGLLARHYAPRTPLELVATRADALARLEALRTVGVRTGHLSFGPISSGILPERMTREMPTDRSAYESELYARLHELDALRLDRIVVELPPKGDEWLACHDRLRRAAEPE